MVCVDWSEVVSDLFEVVDVCVVFCDELVCGDVSLVLMGPSLVAVDASFVIVDK